MFCLRNGKEPSRRNSLRAGTRISDSDSRVLFRERRRFTRRRFLYGRRMPHERKIPACQNDAELAEYQAAAWEPRGMRMERADSMIGGIKRLEADDYLFIGINDDNVDFLPMLSTMRGVTDTPILVARIKEIPVAG